MFVAYFLCQQTRSHHKLRPQLVKKKFLMSYIVGNVSKRYVSKRFDYEVASESILKLHLALFKQLPVHFRFCSDLMLT